MERGKKLGQEKEAAGEKKKKTFNCIKFTNQSSIKTPLNNGELCPKHPTANRTRTEKPLADNFRNSNRTLHFSIIHKEYIIWYIYIKYWETNPGQLMLLML